MYKKISIRDYSPQKAQEIANALREILQQPQLSEHIKYEQLFPSKAGGRVAEFCPDGIIMDFAIVYYPYLTNKNSNIKNTVGFCFEKKEGKSYLCMPDHELALIY